MRSIPCNRVTITIRLVRAVKSRWPDTQVIVTTTSSEVHAAAEALVSGADRHMMKPFGMSELRAQLVDCLARRDRFVQERAEDASSATADRKDEVRIHVEDGALELTRAAEAKHPATIGHGETVAAMMLALIDVLDPEGQSLDRGAARLGALIHDIGNISLPEALLNKNGPLDEDEWEAMRTHPRVGRQLLVPLLRDSTVEAAVSWHHERWDGSGYPDGLAGEAIPLIARVVAVADALSAMTSVRTFREARSFDAAVEEIRSCFGTRYDPDLKDAFETAIPALRNARATSAD